MSDSTAITNYRAARPCRIYVLQKIRDYSDWVGAGRASGRETVGRVAGGAVAKLVLERMGIDVIAYTVESNGIKSRPLLRGSESKLSRERIELPDLEAAPRMIRDILAVKAKGETCGGIVELVARGVPRARRPVFDKLEATIAHALMSIGAVKGIEVGAGFRFASMLGSESNDEAYVDPETGRVAFYTNNAGGFLGGISNGDEIRLRLAIKPTPTVSVPQKNGQCCRHEGRDSFAHHEERRFFVAAHLPRLRSDGQNCPARCDPHGKGIPRAGRAR
jgi:chorismate synthase